MDKINQRVKKIRKHYKCLQTDVAKVLNQKIDTYSKKEHHGTFRIKELMILSEFLA